MSAFKGLTPFDPRFWQKLEQMAAVCARQEASLRGGRLVETPSKEVVVMRLTNNIGGGEYEFAEQEPIAGGGWRLKAGGATYAGGGHARTGRCFEANLNARVRVPSYQIGTVKYDSAGTPFYRFENCCQTTPGSGSGASDDPTTTEDGILIKEEVVDWLCIGLDPSCNIPVVVKHRYRYTLDAVPQLLSVNFDVKVECAFATCTPDMGSGGGGGSGGLYDVWRLCNTDLDAAYPQPGDLLLSPSYLAAVPPTFLNPVLQVDGVGPCYTFQGFGAGTPTAPSTAIHDGCDSEECDNCECEDTCIRISATKGENTDWIEVTLLEGQTWCPEMGDAGVTQGGDTGGLSNIIGVSWVDNAWEISVGDVAGTWSGVYRGNSDGCPTGTFNLVESVSGSPPSTITVSECTAACPEDPPAQLRIAGYSTTFFGAIKTYVSMACGGPSYFADPGDHANGAAEWDGTFPFHQGDCIWWAAEGPDSTHAALLYASDDPVAGRAWVLNKNTGLTKMGFIGGQWEIQISVDGNTTSGTLYYRKAAGAQPMGTYTLDLAASSAALQEAGCYTPIPATITIEEY